MSRRENTKLERLKHAKKRKRAVRHFFLLAVIVFCVIFQFVNSRKINLIQFKSKSIAEAKNEDNTINGELLNNIITNEVEQNLDLEQHPKQEYNSTLEEVKSEIDNYMALHNLNENNFAMFYYQPANNDYFTFNENKYFTAASTIKVPLAMIYYEKMHHGELSPDSLLTYKSTDYEAGTGRTSVTYKIGDQIPISFLF